MELYFNDCLDLLNGKAKIPIDGQSKIKSSSFLDSNAEKGGRSFAAGVRDAKGKWIPPVINGKPNPALVGGDY